MPTEGGTARGLTGPHVVRLLDEGEQDGVFYLVKVGYPCTWPSLIGTRATEPRRNEMYRGFGYNDSKTTLHPGTCQGCGKAGHVLVVLDGDFCVTCALDRISVPHQAAVRSFGSSAAADESASGG